MMGIEGGRVRKAPKRSAAGLLCEAEEGTGWRKGMADVRGRVVGERREGEKRSDTRSPVVSERRKGRREVRRMKGWAGGGKQADREKMGHGENLGRWKGEGEEVGRGEKEKKRRGKKRWVGGRLGRASYWVAGWKEREGEREERVGGFCSLFFKH
jgi:hypothetical protein